MLFLFHVLPRCISVSPPHPLQKSHILFFFPGYPLLHPKILEYPCPPENTNLSHLEGGQQQRTRRGRELTFFWGFTRTQNTQFHPDRGGVFLMVGNRICRLNPRYHRGAERKHPPIHRPCVRRQGWADAGKPRSRLIQIPGLLKNSSFFFELFSFVLWC